MFAPVENGGRLRYRTGQQRKEDRQREGFSHVSADSSGAAGLAGRYAAALFELAEDAKQLDDVAGDLQQLAAMVDGSEDLRRLIQSPVISRDDQINAIGAIIDAAKFTDLTKNFVGVVAANRRLFAIPNMIKAYQAQLAASRGESTAEVVSAKALSDTQVKAVGDALKKVIGTKVQVEQRVDESLLGGLIVKVGSRMIDSSLKTQLQKMRLAMKGVG